MLYLILKLKKKGTHSKYRSTVNKLKYNQIAFFVLTVLTIVIIIIINYLFTSQAGTKFGIYGLVALNYYAI